MGLRFLKIAVVYLFVGAMLGGFMPADRTSKEKSPCA